MPAYSHLLDEERDQIAVMRAAGRSICAIARALQRAKSTVSRELRRNALSSGRYSPLHAAGAYQLRRRREAILEKDQKLRTFVCDRLAEGWTPNRLPDGSRPATSAVCAPSGARGHLRLHLSRRPQGRIPLALSDPPSQAPKAAPGETLARYDQRPRLHPRSTERHRSPRRHWPLGRRPHHLQAHAAHARPPRTQIPRDARRGLTGKTAAKTISVMLAVFGRIHPALRKSITFDNDTAFAQHTLLRTMRDMATWFCDAYASWQKGGVENANGRLRRWLPRHIDIDRLSDEEIQDIVITANLTPRKCWASRRRSKGFSKSLAKTSKFGFQ